MYYTIPYGTARCNTADVTDKVSVWYGRLLETSNRWTTCEANILAQSPVTSTSTSSSRFQALPTTTSKISIHQRTGLDGWSDLFYMRAGYSS